MRRVDKQQARWLFVAVQKAVRAPGRGQHSVALTDRHPLPPKDRVEFSFLHNDGDFGMRIDAPGDPGIGRHAHLFDMKRLASLVNTNQDTALRPPGGSCPLAQLLLLDDWHCRSFRDRCAKNTPEEPRGPGLFRFITQRMTMS